MRNINNLGMKGKKWQIFESAAQAFAENGYENVSMRQIAKINNMQAASLYYHFESKDALLELMYDFYDVNIKSSASYLDELIEKVESSDPHELLSNGVAYFFENSHPIMNYIYSIAITQSNRDERALHLIQQNTFEYGKIHLSTLLQKMIDMGKIEPIDIDSFVQLHSAISFSFSAYNRTNKSVSVENQKKCYDMFFSIIKAKAD